MRTRLIPLFSVCLFSGAVLAQEAASSPASSTVRQACQADIQKLCAGVQPGGGRIRACIAEHRDELSPACHDALVSARAHRAGARNNGAAQDDSDKTQ